LRASRTLGTEVVDFVISIGTALSQPRDTAPEAPVPVHKCVTAARIALINLVDVLLNTAADFEIVLSQEVSEQAVVALNVSSRPEVVKVVDVPGCVVEKGTAALICRNASDQIRSESSSRGVRRGRLVRDVRCCRDSC